MMLQLNKSQFSKGTVKMKCHLQLKIKSRHGNSSALALKTWDCTAGTGLHFPHLHRLLDKHKTKFVSIIRFVASILSQVQSHNLNPVKTPRAEFIIF